MWGACLCEGGVVELWRRGEALAGSLGQQQRQRQLAPRHWACSVCSTACVGDPRHCEERRAF
jgi:hypothetical protein